jgi:hypothetical protein
VSPLNGQAAPKEQEKLITNSHITRTHVDQDRQGVALAFLGVNAVLLRPTLTDVNIGQRAVDRYDRLHALRYDEIQIAEPTIDAHGGIALQFTQKVKGVIACTAIESARKEQQTQRFPELSLK